MLNNSHSSC